MHVDPIVPPVDELRGEIEERALVSGKHGGKQTRVLGFEDVFVVKNKRLVELDQFFGADQVALGAGERRLFHSKGNGRAIDARDDGLLHGNGETFVALLRHRDGFKFYLEPAIDAVGGAVMLAVGKPGELDAAPHIDGIDRGGRKLVKASMAADDDRGSNERHPAANHVDGNHVEALPLIRRKLAKIRAKKIGKRTRGIDAFVPTGEGRAFRAFHDRGADDGDGQVAAPAR